MTKVVNLSEYRRKPRSVCFDRQELNKLLSLYSRRVIGGEWKDYAISHGDGMASFSIFRNTTDKPRDAWDLSMTLKIYSPSRLGRCGAICVTWPSHVKTRTKSLRSYELRPRLKR